jgi:hypothetical protein
MTKAFLVAGIIGCFLFISVFLGYAGLSYNGMTGYDTNTGATPELPNNVGSALLDGLGFIFGAMIFQVPNVPIWINLFIWLFIVALIFMVIEIVRGV